MEFLPTAVRPRGLGLPPAGAPDRPGGGGLAAQRLALPRRASSPRPRCPWRRCAAPRMPSSTSCLPRPRRSACRFLAARFPRSYRRCQPRALRARSRHVRGPPAAAAEPSHHARRRRARHDPARGRQRRGDLSRPRAVRRDRAPAGDLLAALSHGPVDAGRADLPPVRRRAADRCPFHAVLGVRASACANATIASISCWATTTANPARRS